MHTIDHVVMAVTDLDEAGERLRRNHGLASVPGGMHPRWGTGNRIVPLGESYLELIAVVEPDAGSASPLVRALRECTADGQDRWFAVCLADPDLDATASRLGLSVEPGARTRADGVELRWRGAGIDDARREPWLPFFIAWDVRPELHPGRTPAGHEIDVSGIGSVEVAGDEVRLREWLGPGAAAPPIRVVDGRGAGVRAVELTRASGGQPLRIE